MGRLTPDASAVLVIDVQEKLLPAITNGPAVVRACALLIDAAALLGVPAAATEQYPAGLGPTAPELASRLPPGPPAKVRFSCRDAGELVAGWRAAGRTAVVLAGMETHVCVAQTALDLLADGLTVFVCVDAVGAGAAGDHEVALRRLERAGAVPTTAEAAAFEWLGTAAHPKFKEVSRLVREYRRGR